MIELTRPPIISAYSPVVTTWIFGLNSEVQDPSILVCLGALVGLVWSLDNSGCRFNSNLFLNLVVSNRHPLLLNTELKSSFI